MQAKRRSEECKGKRSKKGITKYSQRLEIGAVEDGSWGDCRLRVSHETTFDQSLEEEIRHDILLRNNEVYGEHNNDGRNAE